MSDRLDKSWRWRAVRFGDFEVHRPLAHCWHVQWTSPRLRMKLFKTLGMKISDQVQWFDVIWIYLDILDWKQFDWTCHFSVDKDPMISYEFRWSSSKLRMLHKFFPDPVCAVPSDIIAMQNKLSPQTKSIKSMVKIVKQTIPSMPLTSPPKIHTNQW